MLAGMPNLVAQFASFAAHAANSRRWGHSPTAAAAAGRLPSSQTLPVPRPTHMKQLSSLKLSLSLRNHLLLVSQPGFITCRVIRSPLLPLARRPLGAATASPPHPPPRSHTGLHRARSLKKATPPPAMTVGVLALQGSFKEHIACLRKLGVDAAEIRKPEQLAGLSGLIIPGGESTTMAKLAEKNMLFPALREFASSGKPVWGTCAGLIFLADRASGVKTGGQELLGGLDCTVHRNFFGSQLNSFEMELAVPALASHEGGSQTCRAVFIRAPAIVNVGPSVEVLAEYPLAPGQVIDAPVQEGGSKEKVVVAVKQNNMLATAFHPELTSDLRWHSFFMKMISGGEEGAAVPGTPRTVAKKADLPQALSQVRDLPVFKEASFLSLELQ